MVLEPLEVSISGLSGSCDPPNTARQGGTIWDARNNAAGLGENSWSPCGGHGRRGLVVVVVTVVVVVVVVLVVLIVFLLLWWS